MAQKKTKRTTTAKTSRTLSRSEMKKTSGGATPPTSCPGCSGKYQHHVPPCPKA